MSVVSYPEFQDEAQAFRYVERMLWPNGVVCPHCGSVGGRVYNLEGKTNRIGLKKCGECRKQFTVKVGTAFEHARIPLHKMLHAAYLIAREDKPISIRALHRRLGITYKSARYLADRIGQAMRSERFRKPCIEGFRSLREVELAGKE